MVGKYKILFAGLVALLLGCLVPLALVADVTVGTGSINDPCVHLQLRFNSGYSVAGTDTSFYSPANATLYESAADSGAGVFNWKMHWDDELHLFTCNRWYWNSARTTAFQSLLTVALVRPGMWKLTFTIDGQVYEGYHDRTGQPGMTVTDSPPLGGAIYASPTWLMHNPSGGPTAVDCYFLGDWERPGLTTQPTDEAETQPSFVPASTRATDRTGLESGVDSLVAPVKTALNAISGVVCTREEFRDALNYFGAGGSNELVIFADKDLAWVKNETGLAVYDGLVGFATSTGMTRVKLLVTTVMVLFFIYWLYRRITRYLAGLESAGGGNAG